MDLTRPCSNCPFRRQGGIRLGRERIIEIAGSMLARGAGGAFPCHKTVTEEDEEGRTVVGAGSRHCAGALIFAEKNGVETQYMQLARRLGFFDPDKLEDRGSIFDTTAEWLTTAI